MKVLQEKTSVACRTKIHFRCEQRRGAIQQVATSEREEQKQSTLSSVVCASRALISSQDLVLRMEDLSQALLEYGINVNKPAYFADSANAGVESKKK